MFTQPWSCVEAKVLGRNCRYDQHAHPPSKLHAVTAVGGGAHPSCTPQGQVMEKQRSWGFHLQGSLQHGAQGQVLEGCGKMPPAGIGQETWSGPPPAPTSDGGEHGRQRGMNPGTLFPPHCSQGGRRAGNGTFVHLLHKLLSAGHSLNKIAV